MHHVLVGAPYAPGRDSFADQEKDDLVAIPKPACEVSVGELEELAILGQK